MIDLGPLVGTYQRKARLYPALLVLLPPAVAVCAIWPAKVSALHVTLGTIVTLGGTFLLTQLARDYGKTREQGLFNLWGGMPSVSLLRHRDTRLNPISKVRYHKKLAALVKGPKRPSAEEEDHDPDAADAVYTAWCDYLKSRTRDTKKFRLLFQENVDYGYRRNVWGLRPFGIGSATIACVVLSIRFLVGRQGETEVLSVALATDVGLLMLWIFRFTPAWVLIPAEGYARRLVESIEQITEANPSARTSP